MGLLRAVSSHRGLVPEQFEEYARRQYVARKPGMPDPFGDEAEGAARRFVELDVFTRVRILHQLSVWAFQHPERVRDKVKNAGEKEQLLWVCFWVQLRSGIGRNVLGEVRWVGLR